MKLIPAASTHSEKLGTVSVNKYVTLELNLINKYSLKLTAFYAKSAKEKEGQMNYNPVSCA